MGNPETMATLATQSTGRRQKTNKQTNKQKIKQKNNTGTTKNLEWIEMFGKVKEKCPNVYWSVMRIVLIGYENCIDRLWELY